jgi:hypothetical protein
VAEEYSTSSVVAVAAAPGGVRDTVT